ncbi:DNA polymerase theta-like [Plakobranchus ocellatus]|uniref:DNA polymerase theta n=1 Tax=Plakobranchus ocellatus TaxID=259542 RepID=A0AAV3YMB2_9GAST|nr:DNA polymerase theta-like [Plakobranchus ocellatus]
MSTSSGPLLNLGKRRLGRFPVAPSRIIARRDDQPSTNSCKSLVAHDHGRNTDESFNTSFSASTDNTLLMEVEKMEAALKVKTENVDRVSTNNGHNPAHTQHKSFKILSVAQQNQECGKVVPKTITGFHGKFKDLSSTGLISQGDNKRSHRQSCISPQGGPKSTSACKTPNSIGRTLAAKDKLNTPTASPLDKRQRRISNILPVKKNTTRKSGKKFLDPKKPKAVLASPQKTTTQAKSPAKLDGKCIDPISPEDFEISYSPLLSTPGGDSSVCDIITEESPSSNSKSSTFVLLPRLDSVAKCNNQMSSKIQDAETTQQRKSKNRDTKASCKLKNSLHMLISRTKSIEVAPKAAADISPRQEAGSRAAQNSSKPGFCMSKTESHNSVTPSKLNTSKLFNSSGITATTRRSTRVSSAIKKRPSPSNALSPENVACKIERKCEGENENLRKNLMRECKTPSSSSIGTNNIAGGNKSSPNIISGSALPSPEKSKKYSNLSPGLAGDKCVSANPSRESLNTTYGKGNVSSASNYSVSEDKRQLAQWGLPEPVLEAYRGQGVTTMFEWQAECLLTDHVLDGRNLVFSAPTSAGKTLVAELLVLKRVVETKKKALFVLPFVSVAREKMYALQDAGVRVGGYMGSYSPPGGLANVDVAVCTIEKGNGIVNRLMEEDKLSQLGVMVIDELHMVGDSHRGYLLELMLTKLAYVTYRVKTKSSKTNQQHQVQLIGMSATLPNLDLLARWLDAGLFCTDFRPVPLTEHIKVDKRILDADLQVQREIPASLLAAVPEDSDHVIALCLETVTAGHAVLIFCPTKNWCEKLCETIARKFYSLTHPRPRAESTIEDVRNKEGSTKATPEDMTWNLHLDRFKLAETVEQLKRCPVGVDPMLGRCLLNGVAYHHAGLTFDERDIIEGAFRQGQVKVLVATSTLSSGVNLPARRVIIRTPMFHRQVIDTLTYKQMAGRAGRKGVDTQGESIIICKPQESLKGKNLLQSDLPPVQSCLHFDPDEGLSRSLKRAVLEVVVSGVAPRPEDVMTYVNCTLLSASLRGDGDAQENSSKTLVESCIQFLQDNEFVTVQKSTDEDGVEQSHFQPTLLGSAILASSLSPDEGLAVFAELQKARRAFVLDTDLHLIYLVTPMYTSDVSASIDWYHFHTLWESLTPADRRVAEIVGVSEAFIARAIRGRINQKTEVQRKQLAAHLRFYTALILDSLVREVPLMEVAQKFNSNKGQLQSLQQSAATYAGMITVLCGRLGWHSLELLLSSFHHRLSCGVQPELVDLVRVSSLNATSARMLYNAGYTTVAQLARAKAVDLESLFRTSVPFQSDKQQEGETAWEAKERQRARCIWLTGRKGVTELEAAQVIIEEAKDVVQGDLGGAAISWESEDEEEEEGEEECQGEDGEEEHSPLSSTTRNKKNKDVHSCKDLSSGLVYNVDRETGSSDAINNPSKSILMKPGDPKTNQSAGISSGLSPVDAQEKDSYRAGPKEKSQTVTTSQSQNAEIKKSSIEDDAGKKRDKFQSRQSAGIGRRKSRNSFDSNSDNSSLNHSLSLSSDSFRRNRKSLFGQTVLSPPAGITRTDSNPVSSPVNLAPSTTQERDTPVASTSNSGLYGRKVRLLNGLKQDLAKTSSATPLASTVAHKKLGVDLPLEITDINSRVKIQTNFKETLENREKNQDAQDILPFTKKKSLEASEFEQNSECHNNAVPSMCEELSTHGTINNAQIQSSKGSCCVSKHFQQLSTHNERTISPQVNVDPKASPGTTGNLDQIDFSFSASFDLDSQTVRLIGNPATSEKSNSVTGTRESSAPECSESAADSMTAVKDRDSVDLNPVRTSNRPIATGPFSESFSETLFIECDKVMIGSKQTGERSAMDKSGRDTELLQTETIFDWPLREDKDVAKLFTKENSTEQERSLDTEQGLSEGDEDSSLIAASDFNRFEHFDDGMIEEDSFEDISNSFTLLKTRPVEKSRPKSKEKVSSYEHSRVEFGCEGPTQVRTRSANDDDLTRRPAEEDEDILIAALDLSSSFDASPFHVQRLSRVEKIPQNSTPVGSETNVHPSPSLALKSLTETPSRQLRQRRAAPLSKRSEHSGKDVSKPGQSKTVDLSPAEDCFTDSFSLTLVDRILTECDNLQESKRNNSTSQIAHSGKENKLNKECLNSAPGLNSRRRSTGTGNVDSANSSRHDGSDCVPPTPPDESISHASPLKMSFYSPLKSRPSKCDSKSKVADSSKPNVQSQGKSRVKPTNPSLRKISCGPKQEQLPRCTGVDLAEVKCVNASKPSQKPSNGHTAPCEKNVNFNKDKVEACLTRQPSAQAASLASPVRQSFRSAIPPSQGASDLTQQSFTIIDVCADRRLFESFLSELGEQRSFSLSVACERLPHQCDKASVSRAVIGQRFSKKKLPEAPEKDVSLLTGISVADTEQMVIGLAVSWEHRDVYFVSLMPVGYVAECDPDDSLSEPSLDESLTQIERVLAITKLLSSKQGVDQVIVYDTKTVYITLAKALGITLVECEDPRVADWLLSPSSRLKNLHNMVASFCPEELPLLDVIGGASSYGSIGLDVTQGTISRVSGRLRACTECVLARALMTRHYHAKLAEESLLEAFTDVEMPALVTLARLELNGFGICESELERQKTLMVTKLTALEDRAYTMAGHVFSLTSTDDISKVLYSELKLPINGDPNIAPRLPSARGQGRRGRGGSSLMGSTNKEVLEKLTKFHPLPAVVLEWRRISSALTKSLYALQRSARLCPRLDMPRVYGDCQIFTATGRVSMAEPNIQNIPKDFAIELPDYIGESPTASQPAGRVVTKSSKLAAVRGDKQQAARIMDPDNVITAPVSMRKMFVPFKGGILLAADYSQLELRVIAHLSGDSRLAAVLNAEGGDVFKMIAAQMHNVEAEEVNPAQRQQAKQVCYGMLYGIGAKALGEQLGVEENDAGAFMEMFKSRYPGVRKYLRETVDFCQKNGYVRTMFNRRRFLPSIKHSNPHARAQAERQAVNTTIQGSAADLVKQAMVDIDRKLMQLFPDSRCSHTQNPVPGVTVPTPAAPQPREMPRGAYLVLQLHDELVYETHLDILPEVASLVKAAMEGAVKMTVSLPVKIKVGPSWGELQDYDL